ncbi:MAG: LacI family DNA-binding transcriptional regulator [bacterium]|nr:LacI family DNA-binding transcriptional regulator [bacterium]
MATLKDIANYTGVSCTTVSNVIHGKPGRVSAETIAMIQEAIEKLGYVPNMSARSLVSHSSKVIAMINHVVTNRSSKFMEDPFESSFVGTIEAALREHGYYLMIRTVETSEDLLAFLQNWNVDGLFFTGIFKDKFFDVLTKLSIPIVFIDSYVHHPGIYNIGLEDFKGSHTATRYLLDCGHRRIAFASPSIKDGGVLQERFLGYKAALTEAGIPFDKTLVFEHEMDFDSCGQLAGELADRYHSASADNRLSALVVTADIMAAGVMAGLRSHGLSVPEDISVIGFDDLSICRMITPALTTIHQDMEKKGTLAVEYMLKQLADEPIQHSEVILSTDLVKRDSVRSL